MNSADNKDSHTVVIGAGIVGVATALWLSRAGQRVTLLDKSPPGEGTSHGNAGVPCILLNGACDYARASAQSPKNAHEPGFSIVHALVLSTQAGTLVGEILVVR